MRKLVHKLVMMMLVACLLPLMSVNASAAEEWVAGKHYKVLPYSVRTRDDSKIEVVELFWYGCPHCYQFNPIVHSWEKSLPDDVDFWLSPAVFGKTWGVHAQAFYVAEVLGVSEKMHQPLFDAIARDRKRLNDEAALADFFAAHGVDKAKFKKAYKSFSVKSKLDQAIARGRNYRATGVPALIVNGKYRISASEAGSHENMIKVADFLIAKERAAKVQ